MLWSLVGRWLFRLSGNGHVAGRLLYVLQVPRKVANEDNAVEVLEQLREMEESLRGPRQLRRAVRRLGEPLTAASLTLERGVVHAVIVEGDEAAYIAVPLRKGWLLYELKPARGEIHVKGWDEEEYVQQAESVLLKIVALLPRQRREIVRAA